MQGASFDNSGTNTLDSKKHPDTLYNNALGFEWRSTAGFNNS